MSGTDGVLAHMMKHFLESMLTGEREHHIAQDKLTNQLMYTLYGYILDH